MLRWVMYKEREKENEKERDKKKRERERERVARNTVRLPLQRDYNLVTRNTLQLT